MGKEFLTMRQLSFLYIFSFVNGTQISGEFFVNKTLFRKNIC